MQNQGTEGRIRRLVSKLKRREIPSPSTSPTSSHDNQPVNNDYNDRQLALNRYKEAVDQLKEAIKIRKDPWGSFDFEEFGDESFDDSQFKNKINTDRKSVV